MTNTKKAGNTDFRAVWTEELEYFRFTQVPNTLLECQGHLNLTDGELLTLIHLISYKFGDKSEVYPSIKTLKKFSLKSYPTIQKRLKSLEDKGFIKRVHRIGYSNRYDLSKCVVLLEKHANLCAHHNRKQSAWWQKTDEPLPSVTIKKEDQRENTNTSETENVITEFSFSQIPEEYLGFLRD